MALGVIAARLYLAEKEIPVGELLPRTWLGGRKGMSMRVLLRGAEIGLVMSETVEPDPVNTGVGN